MATLDPDYHNELEELPEALEYLTILKKIHLFINKLKTLSPKALSKYCQQIRPCWTYIVT